MTEAISTTGDTAGAACSKHRYGCVGRLTWTMRMYRHDDGVRVRANVLVCDHCDQAHGRLPAELS